MRRAVVAAGLLLVTAGCDNGEAAARTAMLAELRQLRQTMAARPQGPQRASGPARQQLDEALLPLRDLLQTVVAEQALLRERQAALAGELGRWTALAAAPGSAKEELQALQGRLGQLEAEIKEQDQRHREVQELLRAALDSTAERLGVFLERLDAAAPGAAVPPPAVTEPGSGRGNETTGPPGGEPPAVTTGKSDHAATDWLRPGYQPDRNGTDLWTPVLLGLGILVVGLLAWRLWREGSAHRHAGLDAPGGLATEAMADEPAQGWNAVEALAAALQSQVQRVEQAASHPSFLPSPRPEPAPRPGSDGDAERTAEIAEEPAPLAAAGWFDGELESDPGPPPMPAVPPAPVQQATPRAVPAPGPCWLRLPVAGSAAPVLREAIARDPRVLRRPAPVLHPAGEDFELAFAVLPELASGERSQLLLSLGRLGAEHGNHGSGQAPSL